MNMQQQCVCVWVYVCMQEGDREREYEREGSTLLRSANDYEAGFAISNHHHSNLGDVFKSSHVVKGLVFQAALSDVQ